MPATGGLVIVANHISNVDPLSLGQFITFSGRWPRFLAKASSSSRCRCRPILNALRPDPGARQSAGRRTPWSRRPTAVERGQRRDHLPGRNDHRDPDLWPMVGKTGAARIALQTGCPVIPIGQWGAQDVMYGKRIHFPKLLPRKTLRLIVGDPVPLDDLRRRPGHRRPTLRQATDRIMDAITALVAELREAEPPGRSATIRGTRGAGPG